jgi:hypothetical protein
MDSIPGRSKEHRWTTEATSLAGPPSLLSAGTGGCPSGQNGRDVKLAFDIKSMQK